MCLETWFWQLCGTRTDCGWGDQSGGGYGFLGENTVAVGTQRKQRFRISSRVRTDKTWRVVEDEKNRGLNLDSQVFYLAAGCMLVPCSEIGSMRGRAGFVWEVGQWWFLLQTDWFFFFFKCLWDLQIESLPPKCPQFRKVMLACVPFPRRQSHQFCVVLFWVFFLDMDKTQAFHPSKKRENVRKI